MTIANLLRDMAAIDGTRWETFAPYAEELVNRPVTAATLADWLRDWSDLARVIEEKMTDIYNRKSQDTADKAAEQAFLTMIEDLAPAAARFEQQLKEKLLQFEVDDPELAMFMRQVRTDAAIFRDENIPLQTELQKMGNEYDKVTGGLSVVWDGEQKNLAQLVRYYISKDRSVRERAWRLSMDQWQASRDTLNQIFLDMLPLRQEIARNAGFDNYRDYMFAAMGRFDYTPADCNDFHAAIETAVVPVAQSILAYKQERLGLDSLRPWDWMPSNGLSVDAGGGDPLSPYNSEDDLIQTSIDIFNQLDPELGRYFSTMAEEDVLDLMTRPGKALGGYCASLPVRKLPFIFMNGTGTHDDVQTLLHEAGHAFHYLEASQQPYHFQVHSPMEFAEVASMSMELLAAPHLVAEKGGFYTPADAARARLGHLESQILFLPYMAVVDAFQHWVYTQTDALTAADLDAKWDELWQRFLPGVDWTGFEHVRASSWHRKPHIFVVPFYYIEYGIASVGAMQLWRNSMSNHQSTLEAYRHALQLGGTRPLPQLFEAAGAKLSFDAEMLQELMALVTRTISDLRAVA